MTEPTGSTGPVYGEVPRYGYQHPAPPDQVPTPYPTPAPSAFPSPLPTFPPWDASAPPAADLQAAPPGAARATWGRRVGAHVIDFWPSYVALIPFVVGYVLLVRRLTSGSNPAIAELGTTLIWLAVAGVLLLGALGWQLHNRWRTGGRTGQSLGKRVLGLRLVAASTGQPIGALNAFLRDLVHLLDGITFVGCLWPLWDAERQTFADKLMRTIVVPEPPDQP